MFIYRFKLQSEFFGNLPGIVACFFKLFHFVKRAPVYFFLFLRLAGDEILKLFHLSVVGPFMLYPPPRLFSPSGQVSQ